MLCHLMCIYLLYGSVRKEKWEEEVTSLISSTIFHVNLFHTFLIPSHVQILFLLPFLLLLPLVRIFYSSHTSDTDCVNIILDSLPSSSTVCYFLPYIFLILLLSLLLLLLLFPYLFFFQQRLTFLPFFNYPCIDCVSLCLIYLEGERKKNRKSSFFCFQNERIFMTVSCLLLSPAFSFLLHHFSLSFCFHFSFPHFARSTTR